MLDLHHLFGRVSIMSRISLLFIPTGYGYVMIFIILVSSFFYTIQVSRMRISFLLFNTSRVSESHSIYNSDTIIYHARTFIPK